MHDINDEVLEVMGEDVWCAEARCRGGEFIPEYGRSKAELYPAILQCVILQRMQGRQLGGEDLIRSIATKQNDIIRLRQLQTQTAAIADSEFVGNPSLPDRDKLVKLKDEQIRDYDKQDLLDEIRMLLEIAEVELEVMVHNNGHRSGRRFPLPMITKPTEVKEKEVVDTASLWSFEDAIELLGVHDSRIWKFQGRYGTTNHQRPASDMYRPVAVIVDDQTLQWAYEEMGLLFAACGRRSRLNIETVPHFASWKIEEDMHVGEVVKWRA